MLIRMCGIAGSVGRVDKASLRAMSDCQTHRGPDSSGVWEDVTRAGVGVGLAHRRLSIVDLSKKGAQPMSNAREDVHVVFNGEIYNYRSLRTRLEAKGYRFHSNSDTEALVHGYSEWGAKLPEMLDGDFAFALWDSARKELFLARDASGVCPLAYAWIESSKGTEKTEKTFAFASEPKALFAAGVVPKLNARALPSYLSFSYVPAPDTLFEGVFVLPAGHRAVLTKTSSNSKLSVEPYHSVSFEKSTASHAALLLEGRQLFKNAVRKRLQSDVPLGAYLSGGLDSSYLTAVLSELVPEGPHTFNVRFAGNEREDESRFAKAVAEQFGTRHHALDATLDPNLLPLVTWHLDAPAADIAVLPTYQMAKLAKKHVTVVLTGDGGDEVFGGYPRYSQLSLVHGQALASRSLALFGGMGVAARHGLDAGARAMLTLSKAHSKSELFVDAVSAFTPDEQAEMLLPGFEPGVINRRVPVKTASSYFAPSRALADDLMNFDLHTLLPEDYLMKVNKASMASAVESRVPFLDAALVQFGASLPIREKFGSGLRPKLKFFMRQMVSDKLPASIVNRKKHGFNVPTAQWLSGALREPAEALLSDSAARKRAWVRSGVGVRVLEDAKRGRLFSSKRFWNLFALELWARVYLDDSRAAHGEGVTKPLANLDAYL